MKKLYNYFCILEEWIVKLSLVAITLLVFGSALSRTVGYPINWATDISLLLFAWLIFLGADMALRNSELVNVDIILSKLPVKAQKVMYLFWSVVIIFFLIFLIWNGVPLAIESTSRLFQTLGVSYSWATMSVPVGSAAMIVTICIKMAKTMKKENW